MAQLVFVFSVLFGVFCQHSYDGRFNNENAPLLGASGSQLIRLSWPDFSDGAQHINGQQRPSPRSLSNLLDGPTGMPSIHNLTILFVFFGQALVAEILETAANANCPREYISVVMPKCDPFFDVNCTGPYEMPVKRVQHNLNTGFGANQPRVPVDKVSSYIDGTLFYGTNKLHSDLLRAFVGGHLRTGPGDTLPDNGAAGIPMDAPDSPGREQQPFVHKDSEIYAIGNFGGNENPFLALIHTIFMREHNRYADYLAGVHPDWGDEELFQRARQHTIGQYQAIALREWLPNFMNIRLPPYQGYLGYVDPSISVEFGLAQRFGHSLVPTGFARRDLSTLPACTYHKPQRLCNSLFDAKAVIDRDGGIETMLFGALSQTTEKEDFIMTTDLRNNVYGPVEHTRRDLASLNVMRSREFGIPDYNSVRKALGLTPYTDFINITGSQELADRLSDAYGGNINNIDYFIGAFMEKNPFVGLNTQHLARAVIANQYQRIRDGDRWWYANTQNGLFTQAEVTEMESTTFGMIIRRNLRAGDPNLIPDDVFHVQPEGTWGACPAITLNAADLDACRPVFRYTFWAQSAMDGDYAIIVMSLVVFAVIFSLSMWAFVRHSRKRYYYRLIAFHAPPITREMGENVHQADIMAQKSKLIAEAEGADAAPSSTRSRSAEEQQESDYSDGATATKSTATAKPAAAPAPAPAPATDGDDDEETTDYSTGGASGTSTYDYYSRSFYSDAPPTTKAAAFAALGAAQADVIPSYGCYLDKVKQETLHSAGVYKQHVIIAKPGGVVAHSHHVKRFKNIIHNRDFTEVLLVASSKYHSFHLLSPGQSMAMFVNDVKQAFSEARLGQRELPVETKERGEWNYKSLDSTKRAVGPDVYAQFKAFEQKSGTRIDPIVQDAYIDALAHEASKQELSKDLNSRAFAHVMHLPPGTRLAEHVFSLADESGNGSISVAEFGVFWNKYRPSSMEQDVEYLFKMFDIDGDGELEVDEFADVLRWEAAINGAKITKVDALRAAKAVYVEANAGSTMTVANFRRVTANKTFDFNATGTRLAIAPRAESKAVKLGFGERVRATLNYEVSLVMVAVAFLFISLCLFLERFYTYALEKRMNDLPRYAGLGISVTRGTAQVMNFAFPLALLTMARGLWAWFAQNSGMQRRLPLAGLTELHALIAWTAMLSALIHVIGHFINMFNVTSATPDDVQCTFREIYRMADQLPTVGGYYFFGIQTGLTGYLLVLIALIMSISSIPWMRKKAYDTFWKIHHIYPILLIMLVVHGVAELVQVPVFWIFFISCAIPYIIDRVFRLQTSTVYLRIAQADLFGNVLRLRFRVPDHFRYRPGQFALVNCPAVDRYVAHPFSLASASADTLCECLIRVRGPWTYEFARLLRNANEQGPEAPVPRIRLDGPFGAVPEFTGQDAAVLVASGVGVAPILAVLKDLYHRHELDQIRHRNLIGVKAHILKRIYFLWVAPNQEDFLLGKPLADLYQHDHSKVIDVIETHAFITNSKLPRTDWAMQMLLWAENREVTAGGNSFITGFPGQTHFGRPPWFTIFQKIGEKHPDSTVGVFTCTSPEIQATVQHCVHRSGHETRTHFHVSSEASFA